MKKIVFALLMIALLCVPVFGAYGRKAYVLSFVDEFGDAVTTLTSIEIKISGGSTATIYPSATAAPGTVTMTNPIVAATNLADGTITFWYSALTCTVTATDGTNTRTVTSVNPRNPTIMWPSFLVNMSARTVSDSQTWVIGTSSDVTFDWDASNAKFTTTLLTNDTTWEFGDGSLDFNLKWFAGATADYVLFDQSGGDVDFIDVELGLDDDSSLSFGTSDDITFKYSVGNDLDITDTGDVDEIAIGATGAGIDIVWWTTSGGDYVSFDMSEDEILFVGADIQMDDDSDIILGSDNDFIIESDTTKILEIVAKADSDDYGVQMGTDTAGMDLKTFGATTGQYMLWDASADSLKLNCASVTIMTLDNAANAIRLWTNAGTSDTLVLHADQGSAYNSIDAGSDVGGVYVHADAGPVRIEATGGTAGDMIVTIGDDMSVSVTGAFDLAAGSSTLNDFYYKRYVKFHSSRNASITAAETGAVICGTGTAQTLGTQLFELPTAAVGLTYTFIDMSSVATNDLYIRPGAGDSIGDHVISGDGKCIASVQDTAGPTVTLVAVTTGSWMIINASGTWLPVSYN